MKSVCKTVQLFLQYVKTKKGPPGDKKELVSSIIMGKGESMLS